eukprot:TRINITY_DN364_c0_g2_i1.p1 TRINITY_DN364_c0_g2~~TRINITY_DN364_c0_g2_i1.p1  ORF type:complete len:449 (-),score=79.76 TRINITY_DN364_c0_g2_i1:62-1342(-)
MPAQSKGTMIAVGSVLFTASLVYIGAKLGVGGSDEDEHEARLNRRRRVIPVSTGCEDDKKGLKVPRRTSQFRVHVNDKGGRHFSYVLEVQSIQDLHEQLAEKVPELDFESIHIFSERVIEEKSNAWVEPLVVEKDSVINGHADVVTVLKVLPDGKHFLSGSRDKSIKLWDIASVSCVKTFTGHNGSVTDIDFLPNYQIFISSSSDKTLKFWDIQTGKCIDTWYGHHKSIERVISLSDRIFSCGNDGCVRIWNPENGSCEDFIDAHQGIWVTAMAYSEDHLITAGYDGCLKLWNTYNFEHPLLEVQAHKGCINEVLLCEEKFITGGDDCLIKIWDKGTCTKQLEGHTDGISSLFLSPSGDYLISGSYDASIRLWSMNKETQPEVFVGHHDAVNAVAQLNNLYFLSGSSDRTIKLWNRETGRCISTFA